MMEQKPKRIEIETKDVDGKDLKLFIVLPGYKTLQDSQMVYSAELSKLIRESATTNSSLLSRKQLDEHLAKLGIWTNEDATKFMKMQLELRSMELKLRQGGIKLSEARKLAITMRIKRAQMLELYQQKLEFDSITMESIAENKKFDFLVSRSVFRDDNKQLFFTNVSDYYARQEEQAAVDCASALATAFYGYDKDKEQSLVENKWLKEHSFADDMSRLVNDKGQLIDEEGRLIDDNGRFINEDGKFVDHFGRLVDENAEFIIENPKPFVDDMNKNKKTQKKETTKRKKKKKSTNKK